jgi:hypothetical protein
MHFLNQDNFIPHVGPVIQGHLLILLLPDCKPLWSGGVNATVDNLTKSINERIEAWCYVLKCDKDDIIVEISPKGSEYYWRFDDFIKIRNGGR